MKTALVDFHLHTTCSDGAWTSDRLLQNVRDRGLEYFSITDHDTMAAYPVPEDLQPRCIPALEVDTYGFGQTVHVLGYGVDPRCPLISRLREQQRERRIRAESIIERLNALGIDLTFSQVQELAGKDGSIGRPHIARALVSSGHCTEIQEAFDRFLADGEIAFVPLQRLTTIQACDLIREGGGIAILAHPRRLRDQKVLPDMCSLFEGLELMHPSADAWYYKQLLDLIDAKSLIATGGTDFHARPNDPTIGVDFPAKRLDRFLERVSTQIRA